MSDDSEKIRLSGEYWKQVIHVQMHFNDLCIRTRWLLLTVVSTIVAAAFIAFKEPALLFDFNNVCLNFKINMSVILVIMSLSICFVLRWLDQKYYFRMLLSAVDYGEIFERENLNIKFAFGDSGGLTAHISKNVTREDSIKAANIFYYSMIFALLFIIFAMLFILNYKT
jgi:hypothetical protein